MQERRAWVFYTVNIVAIILGFLLITTVTGALNDVILHVRVLDTFMPSIHKRAVQGYYILAAITTPGKYQLQWFSDVATLGALLYSIRVGRKIFDPRRKRYRESHEYGSAGTSRWQTNKETDMYYHRDNEGIILGDMKRTTYTPLPDEAIKNPKIARYSVHPWTSNLNQQYLIFGPPGASKTTGFVLPNIFHLSQQDVSMVVTDPKGELYQLSANKLRERGYRVIVLDYLWFRYGHRQNLASYITTTQEIVEVANMFMNATRNAGDKPDFWESSAQQLFSALLGFVKATKGRQGTFADVYRMLPLMKDSDSVLQLFHKHKITGAPLDLLKAVLGAASSEQTMAGIIASLSTRLQLFAYPNVQAQTGATDFDLATIADEKTIVYVWISDSQKAYAPIVSAFWTILFNVLYEKARTCPGGKLPRKVVTLIDEMANIGQIGELDTKLTTMRSRQIYPMMIWHAIPQLKLKYGEEYAKTIIAACDTKILLKCNDQDTAEYFSKSLGQTTIQTQSTRTGRSLAAELANATQQFTGRPLMTPDEIEHMDLTYNIVLQAGRPPLKLNKVQYRYWIDEERICPLATLDELPMFASDSEDIYDFDFQPVNVEDEPLEEMAASDEQAQQTQQENRQSTRRSLVDDIDIDDIE